MMDESVIPAVGMGKRTVFARTKDIVCSMQVSML